MIPVKITTYIGIHRVRASHDFSEARRPQRNVRLRPCLSADAQTKLIGDRSAHFMDIRPRTKFQPK